MHYYGPPELAASFRTVRKNTLIIAEEIPEENYGYRPAEGFRTVSELLAHIAFGGWLQEQLILVEQRTSMEGFDYMKFKTAVVAEAQQPRSKIEILQLLSERGERYAKAVESLSDDFIGQIVIMPAGGIPATRSRFDMLAGVKEHEMHRRGQLMLIERLLGITPHLTREKRSSFCFHAYPYGCAISEGLTSLDTWEDAEV